MSRQIPTIADACLEVAEAVSGLLGECRNLPYRKRVVPRILLIPLSQITVTITEPES
jgi:hypothetical protein